VERGRRAKAHHDLVPFDDGTLGGCIDFSAFIEAVHHLKENLKGLSSATIRRHTHFRL